MFSYTGTDYGVTDPTNKAKSKICGVLVRSEIRRTIFKSQTNDINLLYS